MITHHVCIIPEIVIGVSEEWSLRLKQTGNPENKNKRILLFSVIKRWVYLSWLLQSTSPDNVTEAYNRRWMWDEISTIKTRQIPDILLPFKVTYITPDFILPTGRSVQFSKGSRPVELDISEYINNPVASQWQVRIF